jgi:signal transduction histidine kinase
MMADDIDADLSAVARIDSVPMILDVMCRTTGMGFAAVARVTEDRWVACAVRDDIDFGLLPGGELKVATTICNEIRSSGELVVIDDVAMDEAFCHHPTPAMYGFQSYISVPIVRPGGAFFGTLCAIDPRPARVNTPETIGMFKLFAELIGLHLDLHERLAASEAELSGERRNAQLRDQFIAVLGHDLRNPLAAIDGGARLLSRQSLGGDAQYVLKMVQSSVRRMAGLIDNVLDFARGRLGDGMTVTRKPDEQLGPALEQVIAESRIAWPDHAIDARFDLGCVVACDRARIARLLSNLLANAVTHGAPDGPVKVRASSDPATFELSVSNNGKPIPAAMIGRLFQPFFRAASGPSQEGLGLGLYIASEIARAHGGGLDVVSTPAETRFTFRMPSR